MKNQRALESTVLPQNMEQPDRTFELCSGSQNKGMWKPKIYGNSDARRTVLEKSFFHFGRKNDKRKPQIESPGVRTQLPLPPTMISEMMRIFSCAEYLTFVRNPERDCVPRIRIQMSGQHALGDCRLQ